MTRSWRLFSLADGTYAGRTLTFQNMRGIEEHVDRSTPPGMVAREMPAQVNPNLCLLNLQSGFVELVVETEPDASIQAYQIQRALDREDRD